MKKSDVEIAARRAYAKKHIQIQRFRLAALHAATEEERAREKAKMERVEQQYVGITLLVEEIQRRTGQTIKPYR